MLGVIRVGGAKSFNKQVFDSIQQHFNLENSGLVAHIRRIIGCFSDHQDKTTLIKKRGIFILVAAERVCNIEYAASV